jgi:hypothetical protein
MEYQPDAVIHYAEQRAAPYSRDGGRYLRVVLLSDRKTVHNAFFDRRFRP